MLAQPLHHAPKILRPPVLHRRLELRPFRHGGEPGATNINDPSYDHALTRELVVVIRRLFPGVAILFNDALLIGDGLTRQFAGHDNHLHVRFA